MHANIHINDKKENYGYLHSTEQTARYHSANAKALAIPVTIEIPE